MRRMKLFFGIVILCTSCSASKFLVSDVKSAAINEMLKIEPFSYISLIEQGNRHAYNDSVSNYAKAVLNEALETFRYRLGLAPEEIEITKFFERISLEQELNYLIMTTEQNRRINNIPITPVVDSLLVANNKRFGLIVVQNGFTRAKGNYGGQVAKGVGLGIATTILTMGVVSIYQVPTKANSTLYAIIADSENKNIAFYNKSVFQGREPTEIENITKQLHKVFEKYFWKKR